MKKIMFLIGITFFYNSVFNMPKDEQIANYSIGALFGTCAGSLVATVLAGHKYITDYTAPSYNERIALIVGISTGLIAPVVCGFVASSHNTTTDDTTNPHLNIRTTLCGQNKQEGFKRVLGCICAFSGTIGLWFIKQYFAQQP